jgi:hypothetical protein
MTDYSPVTVEQKKKILGLNAAKLYDIEVPPELAAKIPEEPETGVAVGASS